jgi:hypothetical protein
MIHIVIPETVLGYPGSRIFSLNIDNKFQNINTKPGFLINVRRLAFSRMTEEN